MHGIFRMLRIFRIHPFRKHMTMTRRGVTPTAQLFSSQCTQFHLKFRVVLEASLKIDPEFLQRVLPFERVRKGRPFFGKALAVDEHDSRATDVHMIRMFDPSF
jgi:hypothetical protein